MSNTTTAAAKTIHGTKIDRILSIYDGIAICIVGCEIVHIHESKIIR